MNLTYTPYVVPLVFSGIVTTILSLYAIRLQSANGARAFGLLTSALTIWIFGYSFELSSQSLSGMMFWGKVEYIGIVSLPIFWLVFAAQYANRGHWITPRAWGIMFIVPITTLMLVWTTEYHGMIWRSTEIHIDDALVSLAVTYGTWFWIHFAYSYISLLLGTILLLKSQRLTSSVIDQQVTLVVIGALIPWLGNIVYILRLIPGPNIDITPFTFMLSGLSFGWALFRRQLLDIVPVARRTVIEVMSDGVIVLDEQDRVVDINPAAQAIIQQTSGESVGHSATDVLASWPELLEAKQGISETQVEITSESDGNSLQFFDVRISPIINSKRLLTGKLIVLRDITQRKQAEKDISDARDRALVASRTKGELLAKVSHELRTPIGAILGYAELIKEGTFGEVTSMQASASSKIIESSHYLSSLVNELLDQAQFESGKITLNMNPFSLSTLLQKVEPQVSLAAQNKGLAFSINIAADLEGTFVGDVYRLQQILINLLSNAIKFTEAGNVALHIYRPDSDHWAMEVSDTGSGISKEAQAKVFDPFYQVDGSVTRAQLGTGLGLSIVHQLITSMNGQVLLQSNLGQGSTFTVILPYIPEGTYVAAFDEVLTD